MASLWRLFSTYVPAVRDDGRDLELSMYTGGLATSSTVVRGQRHDRARRAVAPPRPTTLKEIRVRWAAQDAEVPDLRVVKRPAGEATRWRATVKRAHTDGCLPAHAPPLTTLVLPQESASSTSQSVDLSTADSDSTKVDPMPIPHHERRKSAKEHPRREPDAKPRSAASEASSSPTQMLVLRRELEQLQADLSSTKHELEHQRAVNVHILSQKRKLEDSLARSNSQAADANALRAALADHIIDSAARAPTERDAELATLRAFLDKTDGASGAQVLQAVQDLNTEIVQLAAAVSDEFPLARAGAPGWTRAQADLVRGALGEELYRLLADGDHGEDPTVVQFAVQAWEVRCAQAALDAFCAGLAPAVDAYLGALFEEMQAAEPQAVTSRWRALTHQHARALMARAPPLSASSSEPISPLLDADLPRLSAAQQYPTPATSAATSPAGLLGALPSPPSPAHTNLDGLRAILALAGHAAAPGALEARFGAAVAHVETLADALAVTVREGVASAWFAVCVAPARAAFDAGAMENTYAGYGDEAADVLCSVALGLEVVRRRDEGAVERTLLLKPAVVLESVTELL